jgi:hypothetical protein
VSIDQMGNITEHGHIIGHAEPGPTGIDVTTSSGGEVMHTAESPGGVSISTPSGAALLLLQNRFGV